MNNTKEAYVDKEIKFKGQRYTLDSERFKGYYKGCDLEKVNYNGCPSSLTDYCRQGFIFKKVKD